jgi:peptidoglycan/xylan/chitin deacetylase (PgdA/CDA1 family)
MSILRRLKLGALGAAECLGLFGALGDSSWRQSRLLVLCYHGVSLYDEHEFSDVHVSEEHLRRRFEILREERYAVLPLGEAFQRLSSNDLPPRSVVLTFDDGLHDFYAKARPLLYGFDYPATVYVATYYTTFPRPVFDMACGYLMWKGRGKEVSLARFLPDTRTMRLPWDDQERRSLHLRIRAHVNTARFSASEKDAMLSELSAAVGIDWQAFVASRMLQLMSPAEIANLNHGLIDVQLHTHRHRTPRDYGLFMRELDDNIAALESMGLPRDGRRHFCYPSGDADTLFYPSLEARGIATATTCEPQMVSKSTHRLNVPRVVDTMGMTETEFRGWLSGVSHFVSGPWKMMGTGSYAAER